MKTNLLICPNCEAKGKRQVLGEVDEQGNLIVLRFSQSTTKVEGPAYAVECGNCGEVVFVKHDEQELSKLNTHGTLPIERLRVHWESFAFSFGTTGPAGTILTS